MTKLREEDVYDYQIELDTSLVSAEDKHFFDVRGYLVLPDLLPIDQVTEARNRLAEVLFPENIDGTAPGEFGRERKHVIELGGAMENAMALPRVLEYVTQFIWGQQYRLVGSRAASTNFQKADCRPSSHRQ